MAGDAARSRGLPDSGSPQDPQRRLALESRVYGVADPDPADVEELRRLLSGVPSAGPVSVAEDPAVPTPVEPSLVKRTRPARAWLAGGVVAVLLAAAIGAGVSSSLLRPTATAEPSESRTAHATGSPVGASSPATGITADALAESLGAQYFDQPQGKGDIPDVSLPGIDSSSTRRVLAQWGQAKGEASLWVARGKDSSFCLIMSVGGTRAASSCTPRADAASTGVRLVVVNTSGGSISATWNLAAGLLELAPFPAGASVSQLSQSPKSPTP